MDMRLILFATLIVLGQAAQDRDALFAQLDRLDPLDTKELPFVKVATGRPSLFATVSEPRFGFLLKEDARQFTVRYLDLVKETLEKSPKVHFEPHDIALRVKEVETELGRSDHYYFDPEQIMDPRGEALVLARALARRGREDLVTAIFKSLGDPEKARSEFAQGLKHKIEADFKDPAYTRSGLLELYRQWLREFPEDFSAEYVAQTIKILEPMVERDREGKAPAKDSVEGLIYLLRDQYHPVRDDGIDGWYPAPGQPKPAEGTSPAERLIKLGPAAVPALLKSLGDETFSRCVWYHSRYGGSFWILSVGTLAENILQEISGVRFYGKQEERQASWEGWWKTFSEKGEEAYLAEIVSKGGNQWSGIAERLIERYPARVDAVIEGIRNAENRHHRKNLLKLLRKSKEARVTDFLVSELKKGPYVDARVEAAQALLERGRSEGLEVFISEWSTAAHPRQKPEPNVPDAVRDFDFQISTGEARSAMAAFLLQSGNLQAVKVVGRDLESQPTQVHISVIEAFRGEDLGTFLERGDPDSKPLLEKEVERMLGLLLDDRHVQTGSFGFSYKGGMASFENPQNADFVACALSNFWPDRYFFDPSGTLRHRRNQIDLMKNVWRKAQGLPPLALVARPDVRSRDPEIPRMVERLIEKPGPKNREPLLADGLGALPWVEDALGKLARDHSARGDLKAVADALSNTIRDVEIDPGEWKPPAELLTRLSAFKGRRMEPDDVAGLVLLAVRALPDGNGKVILEADRLADGAGIVVLLTIEPLPGDDGRSVEHGYSGSAGGKSIGLAWGSGASELYKAAEGYRDERKLAEKALAVPHDQSFEFRISLHFH